MALLKWIWPVFLLLVVVVGIRDIFWPVSINYRVDVTVEAGGKLYSGSSVWSMSLQPIYGPMGRRLEASVRGEAIRVNYPGPEAIYVLRRSRGGSMRSYGGFPQSCLTRDQSARLPDGLRQFQGPCDPKMNYPVIGWSATPSDPTSFVWLSPPFRDENCDVACLRSVVVTRTEDSISVGLADELPWLSLGALTSEIGSGGPGKNATSPLDILNQDFSTEVNR